MVSRYTCPHCGYNSALPVFLPRRLQQIFYYISEHPGTTAKEILSALYSTHAQLITVLVQLSKMRKLLADSDWELIGYRDGGKEHHFKIIRHPGGKAGQKDGGAHVTT